MHNNKEKTYQNEDPMPFTTLFKAAFGLMLYPSMVRNKLNLPQLRIECLDGGIITWLRQSDETTVCKKVNDSVLECREKGKDNRAWTWIDTSWDDPHPKDVIYECTSNYAVPQTQVTYLQDKQTSVMGNTVKFIHSIQLGVFCGDPAAGGGYVYDGAGVSRCGSDDVDRNMLVPFDKTTRFTCTDMAEAKSLKTATVPATTIATTSQTWPSFAKANDCVQGDAVHEYPFVANYVGRFQDMRDFPCKGYSPILHASCIGSIEVLKTSHSSIQCIAQPRDDGSTGVPNTIRCTNTCDSEDACEEIWLQRYPQWIISPEDTNIGVFGEVYFRCSGDSMKKIQATFTYEAGPDVDCRDNFPWQFFDMHFAQLGIYCGDRSGNFRFDDYLVRCRKSDLMMNLDGHRFTCISGEACGESCIVEFSPIVMSVDLPRLDEVPACIQTNGNVKISDVNLPPPETVPSGTYTSRFQAAWGLMLKYGAIRDDLTKASIRITCSNGIIELDDMDATVSCEAVGESVLKCKEKGTNAIWIDSTYLSPTPSKAIYTCTSSDEVPLTTIEYEEDDQLNSLGYSFQVYTHAVQLGVYCGGSDTPIFYPDEISECLLSNRLDNMNVEEVNRMTCLASAEASPGDTVTVPVAQVSTDYSWPSFALDNDCFESSPNLHLQRPSKNFELKNGAIVGCSWAAAIKSKTGKRCGLTTTSGKSVAMICPRECSEGAENVQKEFELKNGAVVGCKWVAAVESKTEKRCGLTTASGENVKDLCRGICGSY